MSFDQPSKMQTQLLLEKEMIESGSEQFYKNEVKATERGDTADTKGARFVIRSLLGPVEQAITAFLKDAKRGRPGPKNAAFHLLSGHKPGALAFLVLREGLNAAAGGLTVSSTARLVARAAQNEFHLRKLLTSNPRAFTMITKEADAHPASSMKDKVASGLIRKWDATEYLGPREELLMGTKLIDLAIEATGLFQVELTALSHGRTQSVLTLTPEAHKRIMSARGVFSQLSPRQLPYVVPPKPWTSPTEGASWSGAFRRLPLVRTRDRSVTPMLIEQANLTEVYRAVNAVQETGWKVQERVYEVMLEAFEGEREIAGLPERDPELAPFPEAAKLASDARKRLRGGLRRSMKPITKEDLTPAEQESDKALKEWKLVVSKAHSMKRQNKAKRLAIKRSLDTAERFLGETIYFPHNMDFRGRIYPMCSSLSPQGADYTKGLLTFAEGKPIGDGSGPGWLAIHGANVYGVDKVDLDERIAWAEAHNDLAKMVAEDPWASPGLEFWTEADKPWQCLAWCFEWAGYLAQGAAFVSSLPIALDGSCNGLQHYSAALRDPVGGKAVNLVPGDKPSDIYGMVAERTLAKLTGLLRPDAPPTGNKLADEDRLRTFWGTQGIDLEATGARWLTFGVDRKITKRPVMTLPYGSTQFSCREFIQDAVAEKIKKGSSNVFNTGEPHENGLFKASLFLQPFVWQSIGEVVNVAQVGMKWLQDCAAVVAEEGLPVLWTTPDGFMVRQGYRTDKVDRIETVLGGKIVKLSVKREDTEAKVDKRLQCQGVAPNWVHSMDGAALRSYVRIAHDNGIRSFAMIHDSYGSVAADADLMVACLKEAFIDLYTAQDPLACFRLDMVELVDEGRVKLLPQMPPKGTLDLGQIRNSDFFFA